MSQSYTEFSRAIDGGCHKTKATFCTQARKDQPEQ